MSFGHPATTHSDAMDYVILNSFGQNPATISEKIVDVPSLDVFSPRSDAVSMPPIIRLDPEVVRIAVPAWSRKVTPRFLETCQRIQRTTKKKVEFWFFPNALGYLYQAVKRRYEGMLPGSVVLPTKNYNDYIRDLNQCDIFLSTFPFGATNGLVDALLQGLPVVNLVGDEVHSCSDSAIVSLVDQPTFLSAKTIDDYVNAVVRLVEDPALRVQISRNILDKNPAQCLFIKNGKASEFAQMFDSIYQAG
jgi:predicted O-linked N-acetylglucosamine transferase (SPINDLY family)